MMMWLLALLTVACVARLGEGVNCTGVTGTAFRCVSCSTLAMCSNEEDTGFTAKCQSTQVCEEKSAGTACYTAPNDADKCTCSGPGFVMDPYDTSGTWYLGCLSSDQPPRILRCPDGQVFDEDSSSCVDTPPVITPACTEQGVFPLLESCSGYYLCFPDGSGGYTASDVVDCPGDERWNPATLSCVAGDIKPTVPTCGDGPTVGDPDECNAFYICSGIAGNPPIVNDPVCCSPNQIFNPETSQCEEDTGTVTCPSPNPCYTKPFIPKCSTTSVSTSVTTTTITLPSPINPSRSTSPSPSSPSPNSSSPISPSPDSSSPDSATPSSSPPPPTTTTSDIMTDKTTPDSSTTTTTTPPTSPTPTTTATTTAGSPSCTSQNGAFQYPGDCKKYYYCLNGQLYTLECTGSLIFNPTKRLCDLPSSYDCPYTP